MRGWAYDLDGLREPAERCHRALLDRDATVATAESLTGGLVSAVLTSVSGASRTYGGGVVAYTVTAKHQLLGVPNELLAEHGPVHEQTARAMAVGARRVFDTTYAMATTGVAGPNAHGGRPAGTVFIACADDRSCRVEELRLRGDRAHVRVETVRACLTLLGRVLDGMSL